MSLKNVNKDQTFKCKVLGRERCKPKSYPTGDGKTKQEFKAETNVNNIVDRLRKGGGISHLARTAPVFADVSNMGDFQGVMNRVALAKEAFASIPAKVRKRFHNDVNELLEFVRDPNNRDEAIKLGIIDKPKEEPKAPTPAPTAPPEPPAPKPPKA